MPRQVDLEPESANAAMEIAIRAEAMWNDPIMQEIFLKVREDLTQAWIDGKSVVDREKAHSEIAGLKKVQERFERYIANGNTLLALQERRQKREAAAVG